MKMILKWKKILLPCLPVLFCLFVIVLATITARSDALQLAVIRIVERLLGRSLDYEHWQDFFSHSAQDYILKGCLAFLLVLFAFAGLIGYLHCESSLKILRVVIVPLLVVAWFLYTGTSLAGLVIPALLLLLFIFLYGKGGSFFGALISSVVIYSLYVVLVNNVLSVFSCLSFVPLMMLYIVPGGILAVCICKQGGVYKRCLTNLLSEFAGVWRGHKFFIVAVAVVMGISFLGALFGQVENCDVVTYHLARVAFWERNHSVNYYFTNVTRALLYPVLAEYIALHFYILFENDALVNLIHWAAYCMGGCAYSRFAGILGLMLHGLSGES